MQLFDRIHGCLLAGACGDALGAPVEFLSLEGISARYGESGITAFDQAYGGVGLITDDTQMTLFTTEGLIRAFVRFAHKGICHPPSVVHNAYRRWLRTQDESYAPSSAGALDGWLIAEQRLWHRRAPGNTCLGALRERGSLGTPATNNSKGCGTVMRDAPFGLLWWNDPAKALTLAAETASFTHGHPSAWYASGALAALIAGLMAGHDIESAVSQALSLLAGKPDAGEVQSALERACDISRESNWSKRLPELGAGWVAEEALAIAVLCALAARSPEDAIVAAVNHGGDSDSTGAITGNIVGAFYGPDALPRAWVDAVELRDVILQLAEDLTAVVEGKADAEKLWGRYPGG